jgi:hypothetical protein
LRFDGLSSPLSLSLLSLHQLHTNMFSSTFSQSSLRFRYLSVFSLWAGAGVAGGQYSFMVHHTPPQGITFSLQFILLFCVLIYRKCWIGLCVEKMSKPNC